MRELSDDDLDQIVRETWGNGWMLPGEPQRMLVRAGYAAGYRAAKAEAGIKPGPLYHQPAAAPLRQACDAQSGAASAVTDGPAADPIVEWCKCLRAIGGRGLSYRDRELIADALERLARDTAALTAALHTEQERAHRYLARAERAEAERDDWKRLAENWTACADAAQQPPEFYEKYNEGTMRAMQALLTRERTEGAALRTERDALRECVRAADYMRTREEHSGSSPGCVSCAAIAAYDAARAKVKP